MDTAKTIFGRNHYPESVALEPAMNIEHGTIQQLFSKELFMQ